MLACIYPSKVSTHDRNIQYHDHKLSICTFVSVFPEVTFNVCVVQKQKQALVAEES